MTNISAGQKRSWDGVEHETKRPREREEPKDWRDVHLRSPARKPPNSRQQNGRRSPDRHDGGSRRGAHSNGRRRRDLNYRRSSDYSHSRDELYAGRDDRRRRDHGRSRSPPRRDRSPDEEKEEGE